MDAEEGGTLARAILDTSLDVTYSPADLKPASYQMVTAT
jgi:hypothetical protein